MTSAIIHHSPPTYTNTTGSSRTIALRAQPLLWKRSSILSLRSPMPPHSSCMPPRQASYPSHRLKGNWIPDGHGTRVSQELGGHLTVVGLYQVLAGMLDRGGYPRINMRTSIVRIVTASRRPHASMYSDQYGRHARTALQLLSRSSSDFSVSRFAVPRIDFSHG